MTPRKPPPAIDAESAVAELEEEIVLGRLHPRQRITEDELLERFGLKRHVVREVLATLERMGLVERRRNIGALVRSFTPREVRELYAVRVLLETEAARRMPLPPPAAALERLASIQRDHDKAVTRRNLREVHRTNLAFHRELFALAGNEVLERAIAEYARQTHAIRSSALVSPEYREQARVEHRAMIRALQTKDRVRLVALCRKHLEPARDAYLEQLEPGEPA
jgi:DNA-binding GntR family transcriptional regulator